MAGTGLTPLTWLSPDLDQRQRETNGLHCDALLSLWLTETPTVAAAS
jgi:hypothetical protein